MQKKDLISNYKNVRSTFCEDSIGRNEELMYFVNLLNSIEGPYSIALNGRWGSGKTFFVKQAKMLMDAYNPFSQMTDLCENPEEIKSVWEKLTQRRHKEAWEPKPQVCVYFDAWEYDSEEDPIAALLYQIAASASNEYKIDSKRNSIEIIGNVLDVISGRNIKDLLFSLKSKNITDGVKENLNIHEQIDEYFSRLLPEHGDRLVIFIDELDRCVPSYAVRLLERIKHYFTNDNITFVFSLNMEQMQHTVKQHYGNGFDAHKYIERFFDLTIPMPNIKKNRFHNLLSCEAMPTSTFQIAAAFAERNHMEMREITRYYAALSMMTKTIPSAYSGSKAIWFCFHFLLPVAVGLQKCDISRYALFIDGEDPGPLLELLSDENVLDYAMSFFVGVEESEIATLMEEAYKAILVEAKSGKSRTIHNEHYNERIYNYFSATIGFLSSTVVLE